MFKKYKKIALVAAACALLGVSASQAQVLLTFAQDGPNVTATWSGQYSLASVGGRTSPLSTAATQATLNSTAAFGLNAGEFLIASGLGGGTATATSLVASTGEYVGFGFGFNGSELLFLPRTLTTNYLPISGMMTFANTTLSALGASDFNNTLAFVGHGSFQGDQEIRYTTAPIPEPSTWVLVGFGLMALFYRYQRRNRGA